MHRFATFFRQALPALLGAAVLAPLPACGDDSSDSGSGGATATGATSGAGTPTSSGNGAPSSSGNGPGGDDTSSSGNGGDPGSGGSGGGTTPGGTVESDDGLAVLTVPDGALPPGTSLDDITVTAIPADDAFPDGDSADVSFVSAYRMEPDGLQLAIPATLTVARELEERGFVLSSLLSEDGAETPVTALDAAEEDGRVLGFSAEIPHFSDLVTLYVGNAGQVTVRTGLTRAKPNGPTSMSVHVQPILFGAFDGALYRDGTRHAMHAEWGVTSFTVAGRFYNQHDAIPDPPNDDIPAFDGNLSPVNPAVPPMPLSVTAIDKTLSKRFKCNHLGEMKARWGGTVTLKATVTLTPEGGDPTETPDRDVTAVMGTPTSEEDCVAGVSDDTDDGIDSVSTNAVTYFEPHFDIVDHQRAMILNGDPLEGSIYDGQPDDVPLSCAPTVIDEGTVICLASQPPMPEGEVVVLTTEMAADIPLADPDNSYIYSAVFDSDAEAGNDWIYNPPYDWDLFQGADRWYQAIWDHSDQTWTVTCSQVDFSQNITPVATAARVLILGPSVQWHIPRSELPATSPDVPSFRVTSFGHDGFFGEAHRGADVNGADPTEALTPID